MSLRTLSFAFASAALVAGLAVTLPSCIDVDGYTQKVASADAGAYSFFDVRFKGTQMTSHLGEYFEIRVVDASDQTAAKAVFKGVNTADFTLFMKAMVPKVNAPYRIDFWADHDRVHDGKYGGIVGGINEKDHAWRRILRDPLPADVTFTAPRYDVNFLHDTNFVDIATKLDGSAGQFFDAVTLLPFNLNVTGGAPYLGKMVETRVVEKASGRLVGLYRKGAVEATQAFQITNILDEQTTYEVSTFVDVNGDQKFNTGEPSFKVDMTSTSTGVSGALDLATAPQIAIDNGDADLPAL